MNRLETLARQLKNLAGPRDDALLEQANCEMLIAPTFGRLEVDGKTVTTLKAAVAPPFRGIGIPISPFLWALLTVCLSGSLSLERPSVNRHCCRLATLSNKLVSTDHPLSCPHCKPLVFAFDNGLSVKQAKLSVCAALDHGLVRGLAKGAHRVPGSFGGDSNPSPWARWSSSTNLAVNWKRSASGKKANLGEPRRTHQRIARHWP